MQHFEPTVATKLSNAYNKTYPVEVEVVAEILVDEDNLREGIARGGVTLVDDMEVEEELLLDNG